MQQERCSKIISLFTKVLEYFLSKDRESVETKLMVQNLATCVEEMKEIQSHAPTREVDNWSDVFDNDDMFFPHTISFSSEMFQILFKFLGCIANIQAAP